MENLNTYTLEELSIGKGRYGIPAPAIPFNSSKYTYLRITDINDDGSLNKENLMSVDAKNIDNFVLRKNDIVFARTGNSTGRSYFYDGSDGKLVYAGFLVKFSIDEKKVNPRILKYYTHSKRYFDWIHSFDTGGTRGNINAKTYGKMPITLPPRWIQNKIVNILKSLDDKIELNNKINRNLEAQAQAIFKSWFIDFEPFKNSKFIDSELGRIPEGWKIKELGKVSKNIREKVASRTNIPVLSAVKEGHLILSEEYFSKQVYSKSLSKYILVKENDYAYNPARVNIGSLGRNTICSLGCVSPVYVVFEIDDNYLAFFDLYFKMKSFKNEVKLRASGSVRQTLSYDDFSLIKVIYPPKSVSSKFNKLSAVLSEKIIRNKKESRSLAQLRDTLLPKLMSGEVNISDFIG